MSKLNLLLIIACVLLLAGCSTQPGKSPWRGSTDLKDYNPQNFHGCTVAEYIQPVESDLEDGEAFTVRWWDCKDKAHVAGEVDLNGDGQRDFYYTASDVVGSTAAEVRASVEKIFSDNAVKATPAIVDGIVNAMLGRPPLPVPAPAPAE